MSYFNKDNQEVKIDDAIYGYTQTNEGNFNFYVKAYQNRLYDPFNLSARDKLLNWTLKKVNEEVYTNYVQFILYRSEKFKQYAERTLSCQ